MGKFRLNHLWLLALVFALVACGDPYDNPTPKAETIQAFKAEPTTNNGNPTKGEQIFFRLPCLSCHTLNGSGATQGGNAPALDKIGANAGTRLPDVTAIQYLRHAITKPEDLFLPGFRKIMPSFSNSVSSQDIEDLVAYLLTLK